MRHLLNLIGYMLERFSPIVEMKSNLNLMTKGGSVYIMTNKLRTTLYIFEKDMPGQC